VYVGETISPIEMLASSNSIADYVDQATFREIVRDKLYSSISEVKRLKSSLAQQQEEMKRIAGEQQNQAVALDGKKAEQAKMLIATNGSSSKLTEMTAEMAAERKALQQQQQSSTAAAMGTATMVSPGTVSQPVQPTPVAPPPPSPPQPTTPSTPTPPPPAPTPPPPVVLPNGGYPGYLQNCFVDANALSYGFDPWGYGCRQCVSYTAWKVLQKTGRAPMYWGNAKDWPNSARRVGYRTGKQPREQSVAVMTTGPYGHVAWVESINPNGTLNISQYNYWLPNKPNGGWGWYSEFSGVSPSTYQEYIYV
jgi:hypothetical protein